jgi:hypothetical protein
MPPEINKKTIAANMIGNCIKITSLVYTPMMMKNPPKMCMKGITIFKKESFASKAVLDISVSRNSWFRTKFIPFTNKVKPKITRNINSIIVPDLFFMRNKLTKQYNSFILKLYDR